MIAEIGINHNGSLETAKQLIEAAKKAGCDAVKLQKRTIEVVYSAEELARPRENPFGPTNGDLKRGLEFSFEAYCEIDAFCKAQGILWCASPWDEASVDFLEKFDVPCHKVAAASLTDKGLLERLKATRKPIFMSTGMSSAEEIAHAVEWLGKERLILMHCVSLYPAAAKDINLLAMNTLMQRFDVPVGYSGHELDTLISACAVSMGACVVERHLTLSREMWGSDQKASIEPDEMAQLVSNIRTVEDALGSPELRCLEAEKAVRDKLRRVVYRPERGETTV
ncbi:N-acetylneuraminate synthase family protein [Desulfovibrio sp. OttesenSCG-928-I05]|nr:N-acetylneuraminate synthase family protein [Desulfovibrio sp. OttesenSCG-928-I05]